MPVRSAGAELMDGSHPSTVKTAAAMRALTSRFNRPVLFPFPPVLHRQEPEAWSVRSRYRIPAWL